MKLSEFLRANPNIDPECSDLEEGSMATEVVGLIRVVDFDEEGEVEDSLKMVASKTCTMMIQTGLIEAARAVVNESWRDADQID